MGTCKIKVNKRFQELIAKLTTEEFTSLEQSILKEGCRDALIIWNGVLIDGHNRYQICIKNNIKFKTKEIKFKTDSEAEMWIIKNQFARRNLSDIDRMDLAEKLEEMITTQVKQAMKQGGGSGISGRRKSDDPRRTDVELAKLARVGKDKLREYNAIKKIITPEQKEEMRNGNLAVHKIFQEKKEQNRKKDIQTKAGALPKNKFQVILCDPPWSYSNSGLLGSASKQYPTMSIEEMEKLEVKQLASKNSVMFMWATNPLLKDAIGLMEYWGFSYKTNMVWVKEKSTFHKLGFYIYGQHELLLIGVKGSLLPIGKKPKSIITGSNKIHSKKPESTYKIIESMYPDCKYVELFARNKRDFWTCWGNENI